MFKVTDEEFEGMVERGIDSLPDHFLDELENVVFLVEYEPREDQLYEDEIGDEEVLNNMMGLYEGVSMYDRAEGYGIFGTLPDTITIFKRAHEYRCESFEQMEEEVRKTIVHEVGHYFGMDEDQISDMGYE
ncbi:MAG: metallopeptidase family protein [Eggerthellaceae bacterium]|nr:metallopeptidase family protein [Eggerthellaceae bacterium]